MIQRFFRSPLILIFIAPLILYAPVFLTGKAIFWGTPLLQFAPWWAQAARTLLSGELPLWNPLSGFGAPLLANYQSALLYPPTWIYLILYALGGLPLMAWAMAPLAALHLAWGGLGMARLARALGWGALAQAVSGLAFGLSGYLVARAHFLSINAAVAWTPWVLLAAYRLAVMPGRRSLLWFALAAAMQLLAGHAQTTWYTLLLAFTWVLFWGAQKDGRAGLARAAGRFALAGGWAAALAAAQLLPTGEYLSQSARAGEYGYDLAMQYSFWPWRFLTLLVPNLFGSPAAGDYWGFAAYWEDAAYLGVLGLLLALYALLRRAPDDRPLRFYLFTCVLVSFVLALGQNTPVFPFLYRHAFTFDMFQAPARWLLWAQVAFALLAGLGAERWRGPEGRALYWSRLATAGAFAVTLGAGLGAYLLGRAPDAYPERLATAVPALALAGLWGLGAGALHLTAPARQSLQPRRWWPWAAAAWLCADLLVAGWGLNPGAPLSLYAESLPSAALARSLAGGHRAFLLPEDEQALKFGHFLSLTDFHTQEDWRALRAALLPNANLLDGIPSASNFDPLVPAGYAEVVGWFAFAGEMPEAQAHPAWQESLEFFDIGLLVRPDADGASSFRIGLVNSFTPGRLHFFPDEDSALCCGRIDLPYTILVKGANRLTLAFTAPAGGVLVWADQNYPGWQARLDGQPWPLEPADRLRRLEAPAGEHTLEFIYRPVSFYLGVLISLLGWAAWAYLWRRSHDED
ncbi:MAG: hypothetical protein HYZ26_12015 [Chloroflexi bacterium]|nr:hypothetical protein [Chloroflexota bacterium]